MSRTTSAKKAQRSSLRKRARNLMQNAALDKLVRNFKKTSEPTKEQVSLMQKALDKAGKTGVLHPRAAARTKSRLLAKRAAAPITATKKAKAKRPIKKTNKK